MKLIDSERIRIKRIGNTHKLSLFNLTKNDFGKYSCRATNLLQKDVTLTIEVTGNTHSSHNYWLEIGF